jgi:hypothetical protein
MLNEVVLVMTILLQNLIGLIQIQICPWFSNAIINIRYNFCTGIYIITYNYVYIPLE